MTPLDTEVRCTMTIPRPLAACFASPADVKAYLIQYDIWPTRVIQERWSLNHVDGGGYVVELEMQVPLPPSAGGTP